MTEKRFVFDPSINHFQDTLTDQEYSEYNLDDVVDLLNALHEENEQLKNEVFDWKESAKDYLKLGKSLKKENEQLKQFPVKLDNRIQKLEESLKALKEMETDDLNTQAVEDVATVIGISLNALMEFRKELKGDVE